MNLSELLPSGAIDALASQLGVPREQAQRGAEALLPSILGGMGDKAGGLQGNDAGELESHLNALGGEQLADNVLSAEPTDIGKGNQLLGNIFGSKDVSRDVASHASQSSGLDPALLKQMLPILAMLAAGYLSKRAGGAQGGLGGILGSVLGGLVGGGATSNPALGGAGGGLGGILGSILGGRR
ncbi:MAG: DUF937 domain-containing protein [Novosphingobium sp.]